MTDRPVSNADNGRSHCKMKQTDLYTSVFLGLKKLAAIRTLQCSAQHPQHNISLQMTINCC